MPDLLTLYKLYKYEDEEVGSREGAAAQGAGSPAAVPQSAGGGPGGMEREHGESREKTSREETPHAG